MTTILLARHGQTDWNRDLRWQGHADPPLNDLGRRQARALAERLAGVPLSAVYSSDLRRAVETAGIVAERSGLPVNPVPALREVDVGSWSGLTFAEIEARFPEGFRRWHALQGHGWDDGESYDGMATRVLEAVRAIARAHPDERVLVVSHGGPIRAIHAHALGIDFAAQRRAERVTENCGLSTISVVDGLLRRLD